MIWHNPAVICEQEQVPLRAAGTLIQSGGVLWTSSSDREWEPLWAHDITEANFSESAVMTPS